MKIHEASVGLIKFHYLWSLTTAFVNDHNIYEMLLLMHITSKEIYQVNHGFSPE